MRSVFSGLEGMCTYLFDLDPRLHSMGPRTYHLGACIWVDRRANVPHTAPSDVDAVHEWVFTAFRSGRSGWPQDHFDVQGGLSFYSTIMKNYLRLVEARPDQAEQTHDSITLACRNIAFTFRSRDTPRSYVPSAFFGLAFAKDFAGMWVDTCPDDSTRRLSSTPSTASSRVTAPWDMISTYSQCSLLSTPSTHVLTGAPASPPVSGRTPGKGSVATSSVSTQLFRPAHGQDLAPPSPVKEQDDALALIHNGDILDVSGPCPGLRKTAAPGEVSAEDPEPTPSAPVLATVDPPLAIDERQPADSSGGAAPKLVSICEEPAEAVQDSVAPVGPHVAEARETVALVQHAIDGSRELIGRGGPANKPVGVAPPLSLCAHPAPSAAGADPAIIEAGMPPPASSAPQALPASGVLQRPPAPLGLMWSPEGELQLLPHFVVHDSGSRVPAEGRARAFYVVFGGRSLDVPGRFDWKGILLSWEESKDRVHKAPGVKHCRRDTLYDAQTTLFYYMYGHEAVGSEFHDLIGGPRDTGALRGGGCLLPADHA